jgi:hypothetical protein
MTQTDPDIVELSTDLRRRDTFWWGLTLYQIMALVPFAGTALALIALPARDARARTLRAARCRPLRRWPADGRGARARPHAPHLARPAHLLAAWRAAADVGAGASRASPGMRRGRGRPVRAVRPHGRVSSAGHARRSRRRGRGGSRRAGGARRGRGDGARTRIKLRTEQGRFFGIIRV